MKDINTIAARIYSETDGVPLFLNAFIQQLLEERVLQKEDEHYTFTKSAQEIAAQKFNIPPSTRDLVLNRLQSLSETELQILQWLAISDRELHIDTIVHLVTLDDDVLFDTLDDLLQRRFIVERKSGIDEFFTLRRRKYGAVLYETMQPTLRIQMHKALAEHLETATSLHNIKAIQHLSHHFRCGQVSGKVYQYLSLAALRLWERGLLQSAMENVEYAHPLTKLAKQELPEDNFSKSRLQLAASAL